MSRTYKDRPYWVREGIKEEREEVHNHTRMGEETRTYQRPNGRAEVHYYFPEECSIDEAKVEHPSVSDRHRYPCYYSLSTRSWKQYYGHYTPPRKDRHNLYWGPMRAAEEVTLNNAVKEYNTHGDIEEDIYLREVSRHSIYKGGYWD